MELRRRPLLVLACLLSLCSAWSERPAHAQDVATLLEQLGSDSEETVRAARLSLRRLREDAVPELKRLSATAEGVRAKRIEELLRELTPGGALAAMEVALLSSKGVRIRAKGESAATGEGGLPTVYTGSITMRSDNRVVCAIESEGEGKEHGLVFACDAKERYSLRRKGPRKEGHWKEAKDTSVRGVRQDVAHAFVRGGLLSSVSLLANEVGFLPRGIGEVWPIRGLEFDGKGTADGSLTFTLGAEDSKLKVSLLYDLGTYALRKRTWKVGDKGATSVEEYVEVDLAVSLSDEDLKLPR